MEIFPLSGFGPIAYFQHLAKAQNVVFEVNDHFPKQTYRSRFSILGPNGIQRISIPLERPNGSKTITKDVKISYTSNWILEAKRALKTAYASSPYFDHYEYDIFNLWDKKTPYLHDLNLSFISFLNTHLELELKWRITEEFHPIIENDTRLLDFEDSKYLLSKKFYQQVQFTSLTFSENLSILDLLFNLGPMSRTFFK